MRQNRSLGSGNSFIATLVERHTRFVMLAKISKKDSHSVIQALIKQSRKLPKGHGFVDT
jgi:IS30 family transposase